MELAASLVNANASVLPTKQVETAAYYYNNIDDMITKAPLPLLSNPLVTSHRLLHGVCIR